LDLGRRLEKEAFGFVIEAAKAQLLAHDAATRPRNVPFARPVDDRFSSRTEPAAGESDARFRWRDPIASAKKGSKRQFEVHGENLTKREAQG
jgi:hypothetical protein